MREKKNYSVFLFACVSLLALGGSLCNPVDAAPNDVAIIGVIPLVAFNISVSAIHDTDATIIWNTNWDANSMVEYGPTISYGSVRSDPASVTNHTLTLDGLSPGTIYHYRIVSVDLFGNRFTSADMQFTTTGNPPGPGGGGTGGGGGGGSGAYVILPGVCEATYNGVSSPVTGTGILTSCTITSSVNGMTDLRSSWSVNITGDPPAGAKFITYVLSQPSDSTRSAFDAALASQGLKMTALAYVMEVTKSQSIATGSVIIQMDVTRSWVSRNGGVDAVRIIRQGDDGLVQILETRFTNYDMDTGYMNFRASDDGGLSLYALIAVKDAPVTVPVSPVITSVAATTGTVTGATPIPTPVPPGFLVMIVILAVIIIVTGLILHMRAKEK